MRQLEKFLDSTRNCEPVHPERFEKGARGALTRLQAAYSATGAGVPKEPFPPIRVEGFGTIALNGSLPENQMMAGFLAAFQAEDPRERVDGISRMLGLHIFIQASLREGDLPEDLFSRDEQGEVDGFNEDLFTAAALAPIKVAGRFDPSELRELARTQGRIREEGLVPPEGGDSSVV